MQRLSIIVPFMGDLKRLEDTLVSVLENQPEGSEVVVVLNEPYDDPYELRGEVKFVEAPQGANLLDCFVCGLAASDAPVVHVIAPGFEAMPGWADAALARFVEADVAAVAPLVVDRENPDRILSAGLPGRRRARLSAWRPESAGIGLPPTTACSAALRWPLPSIAGTCWKRSRLCYTTAMNRQRRWIWPWPCEK